MAVAAAVLIGGCGDSASVRSEAVRPSDADAATAAASFVSAVAFPSWAAVGDSIVGYSGTDTDDVTSTARYGLLRLGETKVSTLPAPSSSRVVEPLAVAGLGNEAVLIAKECDRPPSDEIPLCTPGELAVFSVDLSGKPEWQRRTLPESLRGLQLRSVSLTQPTRDSVAFVAMRAAPGEGRVVEVNANSVRDRGIVGNEAAQYCLTEQGLYSLSSAPTDQAEAASTLRLTSTGEEGAAEDVPLPPVDAAYGAASVRLACDEQSAFVASSTAAGQPDARVWALTDAGWVVRTDLVPEGGLLPVVTMSSFNGVAIGWTTNEGGVLVTAETGEQGRSISVPFQGMSWRSIEPVLVLISPVGEGGEGGDSMSEVRL